MYWNTTTHRHSRYAKRVGGCLRDRGGILDPYGTTAGNEPKTDDEFTTQRAVTLSLLPFELFLSALRLVLPEPTGLHFW